jgi:hypothetical protein
LVRDGEIVEACGLGAWGLMEGLWDASFATQCEDWVAGYDAIIDEYEPLAALLGTAYTLGWAEGFDFAFKGGEYRPGYEGPREGWMDGYDAGVWVREHTHELLVRELEEVTA